MVINRQRRVPIASRALENFLLRVMKLLHVSANAATVCLVTDAQMTRWNRVYRAKEKPTDVLSFPAEARVSGEAANLKRPSQRRKLAAAQRRSYLGDIAIAPAVARRNAREFGRTFDDEMRILVLHGILHLLGYDHETDDGEMEEFELRLRRRLGIQ